MESWEANLYREDALPTSASGGAVCGIHVRLNWVAVKEDYIQYHEDGPYTA